MSLNAYLNSLERHPTMAKNDSFNATEGELVLGNLRLVVFIAKKYSKSEDTHLENIQNGNIGLLLAAKAYDPAKGVFSSYAYWYINGAIRNSRRDAFGNLLNSRSKCDKIRLELDYLTEPRYFPQIDTLILNSAYLRLLCLELTPKQRVVLKQTLAFKSEEEIAQEIGCSRANVYLLKMAIIKKANKHVQMVS